MTIHRLRSRQGANITITHTVLVRDDSGLFHESIAQNVVVSVGKAGAHGVGGAFMPNTRQSDQPDITYAPGQSLSFSPQAGAFVCHLADIVFQSATAGGSAFEMFPQIAIVIDGEWQDDPVQGPDIHNFNFVFGLG